MDKSSGNISWRVTKPAITVTVIGKNDQALNIALLLKDNLSVLQFNCNSPLSLSLSFLFTWLNHSSSSRASRSTHTACTHTKISAIVPQESCYQHKLSIQLGRLKTETLWLVSRLEPEVLPTEEKKHPSGQRLSICTCISAISVRLWRPSGIYLSVVCVCSQRRDTLMCSRFFCVIVIVQQ